eukprot:scaffold2312_cov165-Ochromonas_danica.AAC.23
MEFILKFSEKQDVEEIEIPVDPPSIHTSTVEKDKSDKDRFDKLIPLEVQWLNGDWSSYWTNLENRIKEKDQSRAILLEDANRFVKYAAEKNSWLDRTESYYYENRPSSFRMVAEIIIEELVADLTRDTARQIVKTAVRAVAFLSGPAAKAVMNINEETRRTIKRTGRLQIFGGAMEDFVVNRNNFLDCCDEDVGNNFSRFLLNSQELLENKQSPLLPSHSERQLETVPVIAMGGFSIPSQLKKLRKTEQDHMSGFSFHLLQISPLLAKHPGVSTVICSSDVELKQSLLYAGGNDSGMNVWQIRWDDGAAQLMGFSDPRAKVDKSPIIYLDTVRSDNHSVVAQTAKGNVYLWDLQPLFDAPAESPRQPCLFPFSFTSNVRIPYAELAFKTGSGDLQYFFPEDIVNRLSPYPESRTFVQNLKARLGFSSTPSMIPRNLSTTCAFSLLNIEKRLTSILLGTSDGDIFKFNVDYANPLRDKPLLNAESTFLQRELANPLSSLQGSILQTAVKEKIGNKVLRELFHFHRFPIKVLHRVGSLPNSEERRVERFVSIDSEGFIALWNYDPQYFHGVCWFVPERIGRIPFQIDEFAVKEIQSPAEIESLSDDDVGFEDVSGPIPAVAALLKCRAVDIIDGYTALKLVDPSPPKNDRRSPRRRRSSVNEGSATNSSPRLSPRSPRSEGVDERKEEKPAVVSSSRTTWGTSSTQRLSFGCCISVLFHPVTLSEESSEQKEYRWFEFRAKRGVSSSVDTLETAVKELVSDRAGAFMSGRGVEWQRREVSQKTTKLEFISCVPSHDEAEILLLLRAIENAPMKRYVLVNLICEHLIVNQPHGVFECRSGEDVSSITTGPIMLETLTRVAFILTNQRVVAFGLLTGVQIPFGSAELDAFVKQHKPQQIRLCSAQRLLILISGRDNKIYVFQLRHSLDGKNIISNYFSSQQNDLEIVRDKVSAELKTCWTRSSVDLRKLAIPTVLKYELSEPLENPFEIVRTLLDEMVDEVTLEIKERLDDQNQASYLIDVFGKDGSLGYIPPVTWPPVRASVWERKRFEMDRPDILTNEILQPSTASPPLLLSVRSMDTVTEAFDKIL